MSTGMRSFDSNAASEMEEHTEVRDNEEFEEDSIA